MSIVHDLFRRSPKRSAAWLPIQLWEKKSEREDARASRIISPSNRPHETLRSCTWRWFHSGR